MATYAVGDIQGCYKALRELLTQIKFDPAQDHLWCVGDLINRGPQSLDTLRYLRDLGPAVAVVLGNHDLHFLAIYYDCAPTRSKDTLDQILTAPDCDELADWLRHKPLAHYDWVDSWNDAGTQESDGKGQAWLMVHAGVAPRWTLKKTLALSSEVEQVLQGPDYREFFKHMYGDTPTRWRNKLTGHDRLRAITNHFTRMRFCDSKGNMDLKTKEGLDAAPAGYRPWFEFESLTPDVAIVFGHWAALEGKTGRKNVVGLDTGCVWGRELTIMRLEDRALFSV